MQQIDAFRFAALVGLVALFALPLAAQEAAPPEPRVALRIPADAEGRGDGPHTLAELAREYADALGAELLVDAQTEQLLASTSPGLRTSLELANGDVARVAEALLLHGGFLVEEAGTREARLVVVTHARLAHHHRARLVAVEDLAGGRDRPARFVTTLLELDGVDVRQASNSLRQLASDARGSYMLPLPGAMALSGPAGWVADLAGALLDAERIAAGDADAPPAPAGAASPAELFAPATRALRVAADGPDGASLLDVLDDYADATGLALVVDSETLQLLRASRSGLRQPLDVPAGSTHALVHDLLAFHGVSLVPLVRSGPRVVGVVSRDSQGVHSLLQRGVRVAPDDLGRWRELGAVPLTTVVAMRHLDPRQLSNVLRSTMVDGRTQAILPLGDAPAILIAGLGPWVADQVDLLRRADARAAEMPPEAVAPPEPPARDGE